MASNADIGFRMARLREARGLTTVSLADLVGISQAQVSRPENGRQGFRSPTLVRITESLDVPPFYLFMSDEEWEIYQAGLAARGGPRVDVPSFEAGPA
ncbi:MAG: helix-turn-helix domain-containing protein [Planctomycetota bacterium]